MKPSTPLFLRSLVLFCLTLVAFNAPAATRYVDLNSPGPTPPYTNWPTAAPNIQDAIDAAVNGDTILVTNGVYAHGGRTEGGYSLTNRVVVDKPVTVQSVNGPAVTIIQGYQVPGSITGDGAVRCVFLANGATLSGFTLTNGATRGASGNAKTEQPGGGIYCVSSLSVISNCVLLGNTAHLGGGGVAYGSLYNCVIQNNSANSGGGAYFSKLYNCIVLSNTAFTSGGGAVRSALNNCTITGNSAATYGGGFDAGGDGTLTNCIVYFNIAPAYANYYSGSVHYCCTIPYSPTGPGNFTNDPVFANPAAGDYHLQSNSPCINSGTNSCVTGTTDLDGNPRRVGGPVDIGAYEYQTPVNDVPYLWFWKYKIAADNGDPDGDGANNWQEWRADTIPTNALSVLRMVSVVKGTIGLNVTWQSVSTRKYYLERATNFGQVPSFQSIATNIAGASGTKTYPNNSATGAGPYFYRVGVH
jgi:hypothetical protein